MNIYTAPAPIGNRVFVFQLDIDRCRKRDEMETFIFAEIQLHGFVRASELTLQWNSHISRDLNRER